MLHMSNSYCVRMARSIIIFLALVQGITQERNIFERVYWKRAKVAESVNCFLRSDQFIHRAVRIYHQTRRAHTYIHNVCVRAHARMLCICI